MKSVLRPLWILLSLAAGVSSLAAHAHPLSVPHTHAGAIPPPTAPLMAGNVPSATGHPLPVRKLKPAIRRESRTTGSQVRVINARLIRPFLTRSRIMRPEALDRAGYVVGGVDEAMLLSAGSRFYARRLPDAELYDLVAPGALLTDPASGEVLGLEVIHLGQARMLEPAQADDPARLEVLSARDAVRPGTRLIAAEPLPSPPEYRPEPGRAGVSGRVLKTADRMDWAGRNDVVILPVGQREGVDAGQLFQTLAEGGQATDPLTGEAVQLPARPSGELLVLRSYPNASHALVLTSNRPISAGTRFAAP